MQWAHFKLALQARIYTLYVGSSPKKIYSVVRDFDPGLRFYLLDYFWGKLDIDVDNLLSIGTVHMAVGRANMPVQATIRAFYAFNNALLRERFQVLVDRGMTDFPAQAVQSVINFAGGEMLLHLPQQL